jgi:hypothetical protein
MVARESAAGKGNWIKTLVFLEMQKQVCRKIYG